MQAFIEDLQRVCPHVVTQARALKVYESDGLMAKKQIPACVALPSTVEEVQAIMRLCHKNDVPVVARGAGTGLSGGAMPHAEGVLLSLAKFNQILEIDQANELARVEPGVTNLGISQAVGPFGSLLCARSQLANRLHHRRERSREFRWGSLPKVRFDRQQRQSVKAGLT